MLRAYAARHDAEFVALELQKAYLKERTPLPQRLEFPGVGSLVLHRFELGGRPGRGIINTRFTFENTTGHWIQSPRVTITVLDPATGEFSSQWLDLISPINRGLAPGYTYTTWLDVETEGIHLREGWERRINVELDPAESHTESFAKPR